jgi:hypothetical protein
MWMLFGLALDAIRTRDRPLMYHVVRIPTINGGRPTFVAA